MPSYHGGITHIYSSSHFKAHHGMLKFSYLIEKHGTFLPISQTAITQTLPVKGEKSKSSVHILEKITGLQQTLAAVEKQN